MAEKKKKMVAVGKLHLARWTSSSSQEEDFTEEYERPLPSQKTSTELQLSKRVPPPPPTSQRKRRKAVSIESDGESEDLVETSFPVSRRRKPPVRRPSPAISAAKAPPKPRNASTKRALDTSSSSRTQEERHTTKRVTEFTHTQSNRQTRKHSTIVTQPGPQGTTISQVQEISTETEIKEQRKQAEEEVHTFVTHRLEPAFRTAYTLNRSSLYARIHNRFQMAQAQSALMVYVDRAETLGSGPGFYAVTSPGMPLVKIDLPFARGLGSIQNHVLNLQGIHAPVTVPMCLLDDEADHESVPLVQQQFDRYFGPYSRPLRCVLEPLTIDGILEMIVCRIVARKMGLSLTQVDREEREKPLPIRSIELDTDPLPKESIGLFGRQEVIVPKQDFRKYPLHAVPRGFLSEEGDPSSTTNKDTIQPTSVFSPVANHFHEGSEFRLRVTYDLQPYHNVRFFRYKPEAMFHYAVWRKCQQEGHDWTPDDIDELTESLDLERSSVVFPDQRPRTLEEHLVEPLPLKGTCSTLQMYDIETIGALERYLVEQNARLALPNKPHLPSDYMTGRIEFYRTQLLDSTRQRMRELQAQNDASYLFLPDSYLFPPSHSSSATSSSLALSLR